MASSFRPLPPLPTHLPSTAHIASQEIEFKQIAQSVKLLYLRRQYKQCANLCEKHLTQSGSTLHPLYQVFLNFFAGLACDTQSRSMSSRSPLLSGTLADAEQFFLRALQVLPTALSRHDFNALGPIQERNEERPTRDIDNNSPRNSLNSQSSTTAPSTAATSVSGCHEDSSSSCENSPMKCPSPLFVRKYNALPETPTKTLVDSNSLFSIPTSSQPTNTPRSPYSLPKIAAFKFLEIQNSPVRKEESFVIEQEQVCVYNEAVISFNTMISKHIISLQHFRGTTEATREVRRPTSRDGNGKLEMSPEERMERIVKGRARDWRRERFDPRRNQHLCEVALSEL